MRNSNHRSTVWFMIVAITAVIASTTASAQDVEPVAEELSALGPIVDHRDGAALDDALEHLGLGDVWRKRTGLGDTTRKLLVEYAGPSSESSAARLATALTDITRTQLLQNAVAGDARKSVALLSAMDQYQSRLVRQVDREEADLAETKSFIQSVAIDMFSNAGGRSPDAIAFDSSALLRTRRIDELTSTVLEVLARNRDRLSEDLAQSRLNLNAVKTSREAVERSHEELSRVARELPVKLSELEASIDGLIVAAATAYRSADVAGTAGLSLRALEAYLDAEAWMTESQPECGITWNTIAAIGQIESRHGTHRGNSLLPDGRTEFQIVGVALDGTAGNNPDDPVAVVPDTDGGVYDGDPIHDRAIGPMQFIPETWRRWSVDADEDGRRDPNDMDDAAVATARLLCANGPVNDASTWNAAVFTYNQSRSYVDEVRHAYDELAAAVFAAGTESLEFSS